MYIYETNDIDAVETCIKAFMKKYQYRKYKEVYQTNIDIIKNFINKCGDIVNSEYNIHLINKNKSQNGGSQKTKYNYYFALYKY